MVRPYLKQTQPVQNKVSPVGYEPQGPGDNQDNVIKSTYYPTQDKPTKLQKQPRDNCKRRPPRLQMAAYPCLNLQDLIADVEVD